MHVCWLTCEILLTVTITEFVNCSCNMYLRLHCIYCMHLTHIFLQFINLVLNFFKAVLLLWGKDVRSKSLVASQPSLTLKFLFQLVFREVTSVSLLITYCLMHVKASFPEIVHGNFALSIS